MLINRRRMNWSLRACLLYMVRKYNEVIRKAAFSPLLIQQLKNNELMVTDTIKRVKFYIKTFINDFSCLSELEITVWCCYFAQYSLQYSIYPRLASILLCLCGFCTQSSAVYASPATFPRFSHSWIAPDKKLWQGAVCSGCLCLCAPA